MNSSGKGSATLGCELAGEVVSSFGEVRLRVLGTSMVPSVHPGDLVSIERAGPSEISAGEIALYLREGRLFAHRVVARAGTPEQPLLIFRGDRLRHNDPPVCTSELLGRVRSIERGRRRIQPRNRLSMWERMIALLLRSSDRATYLYLRLDAGRRGFLTRRAECQV
jgi:signal peptidase I